MSTAYMSVGGTGMCGHSNTFKTGRDGTWHLPGCASHLPSGATHLPFGTTYLLTSSLPTDLPSFTKKEEDEKKPLKEPTTNTIGGNVPEMCLCY